MIKPGDVVTALLPGARETKRRPAIVISTVDYGATRPDVPLTIVTSRVEDADTAYDCVLFDWREAGLKTACAMRSYTKCAGIVAVKSSFASVRNSVFRQLCHSTWYYLFTVEASQAKAIGHLSEADWNEVQARLRLALEV